MTRVALDSNVLIYAELEPDSEKGTRAADLILRAARDGVIPVQVLGEYLRFVQRRRPATFAEAIRQASIYRTLFLTPPTMSATIDKASELAHGHRIQLWDGVVCAASIEAEPGC
jgi:predicted nucleic acid-binding protein